jgi:hypothetical protein
VKLGIRSFEEFLVFFFRVKACQIYPIKGQKPMECVETPPPNSWDIWIIGGADWVKTIPTKPDMNASPSEEEAK